MSLSDEYEIRPLHPEEFALVTEKTGVQWPDGSVLVGAFHSGNLVGHIGLVALPHIEGIHVDDEERTAGGEIARAMYETVEAASRLLGRQSVFAFVPETHPGMATYLRRAGFEPFNVTVWKKDF